MRHLSQQKQRLSWRELPVLPGVMALVLGLGLFYAQTTAGSRPEGVGPQVREVNTVTTADAECVWG